MNYFTSIEDLNQYRQFEGLSQSFLKLILSNNVNKKFKETIPLLIGSYLDSLLTSPDLTDDLFQVGLTKRPSEAIKGFLDDVFKEALIELEELIQEDVMYPVINPNLEVWKLKVMMKVKEANYQPKWREDAVWNSVVKDGQGYWEELVSSQGKMLITAEEKSLCDTLASLVCSSSITAKYFLEDENEKYYQKPLYWKHQDFDCKGLLDILILEEDTKTIYIIDLKSTSVNRLEDWFQICRTKGYPFQMAWYYLGVLENYSELIREGWTIKCRWLVVPTNTFKFKPWIVPCTNRLLEVGKRGCVIMNKRYIFDGQNQYDTLTGFKETKGYEQALEILRTVKEEGLTDYDVEHYLKQGKLTDTDSNNYYFT